MQLRVVCTSKYSLCVAGSERRGGISRSADHNKRSSRPTAWRQIGFDSSDRRLRSERCRSCRAKVVAGLHRTAGRELRNRRSGTGKSSEVTSQTEAASGRTSPRLVAFIIMSRVFSGANHTSYICSDERSIFHKVRLPSVGKFKPSTFVLFAQIRLDFTIASPMDWSSSPGRS